MLCVRDRMTAPAVTVNIDTPSLDIMKLFASGGFSAVPVLDGEGCLAGVVSTTDLVKKVIASTAGSTARAFDLMSAPAIVAKPGEPLEDAAWRLVAARAHRLVVIEGDKPIGILSCRDVLHGLLDRSAPQPIRTIMSRPVTTIDVGDSISKAVHQLAYAGVHGLVVLEGSRPVGVFTHTEALAVRHLPPLLLDDPVEEVMSYETVCFDVATSIDRVAKSAATMNVRRVLVVEERQLAGIVSDVDLIDVLAHGPERTR